MYFGFQVRVYTPKRLAQQLETAKEEFVRVTVGIWKEQKILLPKLIESYAKDIKLTSQGLIQMVHRYLPENLRTAVYKCQQGRSNQIVEWAPYNFNFRYLLPRELTFPHTNWHQTLVYRGEKEPNELYLAWADCLFLFFFSFLFFHFCSCSFVFSDQEELVCV